MKKTWIVAAGIGSGIVGFCLGFLSEEPTKRNAPSDTSARFGEMPSATQTSGDLLSVDAITKALSGLSSLKSLEDYARAADDLAALSAEDFPKVLAALIHSKLPERWESLSFVLATWFARDREAASEWVRARMEAGVSNSNFASNFESGGAAAFEREMIRLWAGENMEAGIDFLRAHPHFEARDLLLTSLTEQLKGAQCAEALNLLRSLPVGQTRGMAMGELFYSWAQKDMSAAVAAATGLPPGPERQITLGQTVRVLAHTDPLPALQRADELRLTDGQFRTQLIILAGAHAPRETAQWLETRGDEWIQTVGAAFISKWTETDPVSAFEWAWQHGISLLDSFKEYPSNGYELWPKTQDEIAVSAPIGALGTGKSDEVLAWLKNQPPGKMRDNLMESIFRRNLSASQATLDLFISLDAETQLRNVRFLVTRQLGDDAAFAQNWIGNLAAGPVREEAWRGYGLAYGATDLPPGSERDAMLDGSALNAARERKFEAAFSSVAEIHDPARQRDAFDAVMWESLIGNSAEETAKAREALKASTLPAEWKSSWEKK
jgi:hypothetical protein